MTMPRIPLATPPYSEPVQAALDRVMPPGVPPLGLFRAIATNERVFLRMMAGGLLDRGAISLRDRELMIDRTCHRCGSEYEWGVHVAFFGPKIGLTEQETRDLCAADLESTAFAARDRALLRLADSLHDRADVDDDLWSELARHWSPAELVELVVLAGYYHAVSFATNAFRVPLEPFAARFPSGRTAGGASEKNRG
jgi:4-carboxymuconolactone decarboxylase